VSDARDIAHDADGLILKDASKDLVKASGGTDGAGVSCGSRQQRMSDVGNRFTPHFLRVDEVGKLEDVALNSPQWPHVTRALAKRQGFVLVRAPTSLPSNADWHVAMASLSKEAGDVIQRLCEALPDGVSAEEIRKLRIREEIMEAQERLAALDALAVQVLADEAQT
jgi:hypothetical protein